MAANANFDAILSTTLNNYRDTLEDQVFTAQPLSNWLKSAGQLTKEDGGAEIVVPLRYGQNQAAGSYSGYDTLPLTASAGLSAAEFKWKQFAATIAINGLEEAQNHGDEAFIKLLTAKISQAEDTISEQMNIMFWANGTGNGGKDWNGLVNLLAPYDVATGGLGNISLGISAVPLVGAPASSNQWWSPYVDYGTGGVVANQTVAINGVNQIVPNVYAPASQVATSLTQFDMTHLFNLASKGKNKPDFGIMSQNVYEKYESLLTPDMRFVNPDAANGGFDNLLHKTMTLMFDVECPNSAIAQPGSSTAFCGSAYFLNSKYITLTGLTDHWFENTPFERPPNQDARYAQILVYGQLVISNRMRHGVMLNRY